MANVCVLKLFLGNVSELFSEMVKELELVEQSGFFSSPFLVVKRVLPALASSHLTSGAWGPEFLPSPLTTDQEAVERTTIASWQEANRHSGRQRKATSWETQWPAFLSHP